MERGGGKWKRKRLLVERAARMRAIKLRRMSAESGEMRETSSGVPGRYMRRAKV